VSLPMHSSRRGFAMAFVLILALVASLMLGAALTRQNAQTLTVARQVEDYQMHHDILGARSIVEEWMRKLTPADMVRLAASKGEDFRFEIGKRMTISITLIDGQGTLLSDASLAPEVFRDVYEKVLERLPEDTDGLVRSYGPPQISVQSSPPEVLAAFLEDGGEDFAEEVVALREKTPLTESTFFDLLKEAKDGRAAADELRPLIVFQPVIWRVGIKMTDQRGGERFFAMLAELGQNSLIVYDWLEGAALAGSDSKAEQDKPRRRSSRSSGKRRSRDSKRTP